MKTFIIASVLSLMTFTASAQGRINDLSFEVQQLLEQRDLTLLPHYQKQTVRKLLRALRSELRFNADNTFTPIPVQPSVYCSGSNLTDAVTLRTITSYSYASHCEKALASYKTANGNFYCSGSNLTSKDTFKTVKSYSYESHCQKSLAKMAAATGLFFCSGSTLTNKLTLETMRSFSYESHCDRDVTNIEAATGRFYCSGSNLTDKYTIKTVKSFSYASHCERDLRNIEGLN